MSRIAALLWVFVAFVAIAAQAPGPDGGSSHGPSCLGWDDAWVAYRYSAKDDRWKAWKSPAAAKPMTKGMSAVGPNHLAVIDANAGYAGWLFDLRTNQWVAIPKSPVAAPVLALPGGGQRPARLDPITVEFAGDLLLFWGMSQGPPHGAVLDTKTMKWTAMPAAPVALRYRCLSAVVSWKLVVWGGYPNFLQDGAAFDLKKYTWEKLPAAPLPFVYGMTKATWREQFLVVGGRTNKGASRAGAVYDPATKAWGQIGKAPIDTGGQSACAVSADRLFLWSGTNGDPAKSAKDKLSPLGAIYDLRRKEWKEIPEAPIPPRLLPLAHVEGQRVFVWGGWDKTDGRDPDSRRDGAVYDMDKGVWKKIADMPGPIPYILHPGW
jgi:hypothetical protein